MFEQYDVIVVGGGHAGAEASLAAARLNQKTLLITGSIDKISNMPCNPSIGGPAKGILVREIDALGGQMGKVADATAIQFKMLNQSKGPAVRALRVQSDKIAYSKYMQEIIIDQDNLDLHIGYVSKLLYDHQDINQLVITGVEVDDQTVYHAQSVIICTGTYLDSKILQGDKSYSAGPDQEPTSNNLSKSLMELGFTLRRLKTGTPPRILSSTIDFTMTKLEPGSDHIYAFSHNQDPKLLLPIDKQIPCYLTSTTSLTHQIINENLHLSSMYSGQVVGVGPRYCPSIEDKIVRFADKERHQIFLEPETLDFELTYIQGFSTSMPKDVQEQMVRSLPGFSNAKIVRYAYAIEYDAIDPLDLKPTLESKKYQGLFFAGQINGTSGYEEAAAQGLMAGINAVAKIKGSDPLILRRDQAYIGVLIDDLVTKGVSDPYRMMTSRAEYRLLLRHDNALQRLIKYGYLVGLINQDTYDRYLKKMELLETEINRLKIVKINPSQSVNNYLEKIGSSGLKDGVTGYELLKRPEVSYLDIINLLGEEVNPEFIKGVDQLANQIEIEVKYFGYIEKAYRDANKMLKLETMKIPDDINYDQITNIASEAKEKLNKVRPLTVSQAMRISGVNPSDIAILLVYLESYRRG